jgi:hypothetical protein
VSYNPPKTDLHYTVQSVQLHLLTQRQHRLHPLERQSSQYCLGKHLITTVEITRDNTDKLHHIVQCLLMLQQTVHIVTSVKQVSARLSTKKCGNSHLTYWYSMCEAPGTHNAICQAADNVAKCQGQTSELCCVGLQTVQRTVRMAALQLEAVYPSTHTSPLVPSLVQNMEQEYSGPQGLM